MRRMLLRAMSAPGLLLLAALGVAIQTSVFTGPLLRYFQPDVILTLILWCALKRNFGEGGVLTLCLGEIAEIHSASPQGLFLGLGMLIYLGVRWTSRFILIQNRLHWVLLSLVTLTLFRLGIWGGLLALDAPVRHWFHQLILFLPALGAQSVFAYFAFPWLERYDWETFKSAESQRLLEDEPPLESEA